MSDPDVDLECEIPINQIIYANIKEENNEIMDGFEIVMESDPVEDFIIEHTDDGLYFDDNIDDIIKTTSRSSKDDEDVKDENDEREECEEGEGVLYTCSSCDMGFYSVMDHIKEYHKDQEVVVEMEEEEEAKVNDFITPDADDDLAHFNFKDVTKPETVLSQEDCIDSTGMSYTRKTVKIDQFWDKASAGDEKVQSSFIIMSEKEAEAEEQPASSQLYNCTVCSATFTSVKSLTAHMRIHSTKVKRILKTSVDSELGGGPFECEECQTIFHSNKSLRLHARMHDPDKVRKDHYGEATELMAIESEETQAKEQFFCSICEKAYNKEFEEVHIKSHSNAEQFHCHVCNKMFLDELNLQMHMNAHQEAKPSTLLKQNRKSNKNLSTGYPCQYCGREFQRPHEKVKHERIHTGEKPFSCEICGKSFRVSYCLTLHMRTHTGSRPYVCPHCKKRFKAHSVYNHHLLTHSDVRKYQCPFCPKAFKTSVQLAGHKKSHTKPFSCSDCNRPFATLYAVRLHMEIHKRPNKLNFKCRLCGATYVRAFALRDHLKEQHNVNEDMDENLEDEHNADKTIEMVKEEGNEDEQIDDPGNGVIIEEAELVETIVEDGSIAFEVETEEIVEENWLFQST